MASTPNLETFDLIIIGSGSGNSIPDYLDDWKIALVERGVFGGTCLNAGCIPSKMFVLPADAAHAAADSSRLGISTSFNGADWPAIRDRVFGRIDAISEGGEEYRATGTPNVTLVRGTAAFEEAESGQDQVVTITETTEGGPRRLSAPRYLLAAGARPVVPTIPGLDSVGYHTSDTIMRLDDLPDRLGILGGGFIAAEMGHVFASLGSRVDLLNRSNRLLRPFDDEIAERFTTVFSSLVNVHLGTVPSHIDADDEGIHIHTDGQDTITVDELLVATSRRPNSDLVNATAAGLSLHPDGRVMVDETLATEIPGIYAIGDLTNRYQLKHLANAEAKAAFWNLAHPQDQRSVSYKAIPGAVFSDPQIAFVGLTEREATEQNIPYVVGHRDYGDTAYGWALVDETSFAKVLLNPETGLIVGAHIIGPQASTLIQPLIQAMQFDQPARDVAENVFYIHPALSEVVENALIDGLNQAGLQGS